MWNYNIWSWSIPSPTPLSLPLSLMFSQNKGKKAQNILLIRLLFITWKQLLDYLYLISVHLRLLIFYGILWVKVRLKIWKVKSVVQAVFYMLALSPPSASPPAVLALQRWWIHPSWAGRCRKERSAGCWEPRPLPATSFRWSCLGENPCTPYRWWSTGSRQSCWNLLRTHRHRNQP